MSMKRLKDIDSTNKDDTFKESKTFHYHILRHLQGDEK